MTVLSARRTFWEKATALHAEAHRPTETAAPQYFSRHYYDLAMLLQTDEGKAAVADLDLLETVAKHKAIFFRSGWASYDTARPGTLRLMPSEARIKDLRADYRAMAPMMFDEKPPAFDEILAQIRDLQDALKTYKTLSISNLRHLAGRNLHRLLQSAAGHEAVIKVEAFPFTRYGILHGTVIRVATDATPEPDARQLEEMSSGNLQSSVPVSNAQRVQNLVYPVVIKPLETDILVSGRAVPLAPGMTVTIEIKTGQRRILEYLFSPLAEVASGAMKER